MRNLFSSICYDLQIKKYVPFVICTEYGNNVIVRGTSDNAGNNARKQRDVVC